ncbi:RNase H domain-containing protein [Caerostris darwini]|uniref:RNase H domain-containing protein n=1 Tax=Caerostris darwini TaxID=1538125 RepID=A0AAV4VU39_9ARAC|nr:RNase H domain-containing protein [Caerostris darwini]
MAINQIKEAHIITDSRSVLQALDNINNIDPLIIPFRNSINRLDGKIHLHWIKAHAGFAGNERADVLAKSAINKPSIDIQVNFTPTIVKRLLHKHTMAEWQTRWLQSIEGREVFELYKEVKENRIQGDFFLNQLITGHGTIGTHQARIFNKSPSCQCGHPTEDRKHIIYQCPQWNNIRS